MPASQVLQQLYSLDPSSPNFLRVLFALIRNDEDEQYSSGLQGEELTRLVDFLDNALCYIPPSDDGFRRCLRKLRAICGSHTTLPSSHIISGDLTRIGENAIAYGNFADVWQGDQGGKRVCIKALRISLNDTNSLKKSFFKEAVVWTRLRHPNIVPFLGVTIEPLQIVSEWMPNRGLTHYVTKNPSANRIALLLDVAEGLNYLHASYTIHGDLKGPNILITSDGHACLADFGLASIVHGNDSIVAPGYSVRWTAPEILEGAEKITREADVFSFGMVVMETFTGRYPLSEMSGPSVVMKTMAGERPVYPRGTEELGFVAPVWNMTVDCWRHDPAHRPTMAAVVDFLRERYTLHAVDSSLSTLSPTQLLGASQGSGNLFFSTQEPSITQSLRFSTSSPGPTHGSWNNPYPTPRSSARSKQKNPKNSKPSQKTSRGRWRGIAAVIRFMVLARTVVEGQGDVVTPEGGITDPVDSLGLDSHCAQEIVYQHGDLRGCLRGTRGTILEEIESWISGSARPSIFWLDGVAGVGKSAIAQAVVERCNAGNWLVSTFFCSRDIDYKTPRLLFPSLAIQLARQNPKIRSTLVSLLRSNPDIVYESPSEQVEEFIVKPLQSTDGPVVIVIDALDEWGDDASQSGVVSALEHWVREIPKVKFLVTSRPKPHISASLNFPLLSGVVSIYTLHVIEQHIIDKDIRSFLEHELSLLATQEGLADWPTAAQLVLLCARAAGLFVYAVSTVKFLGRKHTSPNKQYAIVEQSPDDTVHEGTVEGVHGGLSLDCLCTSTFQASFRYNDAEDDDAVRSVLAGVVLVTYPIPPSAIADLTSLEVSEVMTILESIQPLLRLQGPDQPVRPFHKLLSDLLTSNRCADERFYIAPGKFHTLIALGCLNLMNKTLEGGLSPLHHTFDTEIEHPHDTVALKYAYKSWHIHLAKSRELVTSLVPPLHHLLEENFTSWLGVTADPLTALNGTISWLGEMVEDKELLNAAEECLLRVRSST